MQFLLRAVWLPLLLCLPAAAQAASAVAQLGGRTGAMILLGHVAPLLHLMFTRKVQSCYRASYCMIYVMLLLMAWLLAFVLLDLSSRLDIGILPLLLPFGFWIYALTMGSHLQLHNHGDAGCRPDGKCEL